MAVGRPFFEGQTWGKKWALGLAPLFYQVRGADIDSTRALRSDFLGSSCAGIWVPKLETPVNLKLSRFGSGSTAPTEASNVRHPTRHVRSFEPPHPSTQPLHNRETYKEITKYEGGIQQRSPSIPSLLPPERLSSENHWRNTRLMDECQLVSCAGGAYQLDN